MDTPVKTVGVVGAGYVGLVTAACLSHKGFFVVLAEQDQQRRELVKQGLLPFFEPGLEDLLRAGLAAKTIVIAESLEELFAQTPEIIVSCVGTPSRSDGAPDLTSVHAVVKRVSQLVTRDLLFVHKSTVPVGVTRETDKLLKSAAKHRDATIKIAAASNPEFLREGCAVQDFLTPSRVVCGVVDDWSRDLLRALHEPFLTPTTPFLVYNFESAELVKYAANAMLATRLSFINQLAALADKVGADIEAVRQGMGSDARIGTSYLAAGIGYGGSCLPKDVRALDCLGKNHGIEMTLARTVDAINTDLVHRFVRKIIEFYGPELRCKHVGVWGLAFKPGTDDTRYAPSIPLISSLLKHGAQVTAFDPKASILDHISHGQYHEASSAQEVLEHADCLVILTEWPVFLKYEPKDFVVVADNVVFDGRNCFDPHAMHASGLTYYCVGRNVLSSHKLFRQHKSPGIKHPHA